MLSPLSSLLLEVVCTLGDVFGFFTGQGVGAEHSVVAAAHQAGQALHTDNVAAAVLGGIARVGQELGGGVLAIHVRWALEANDLLGIAVLKEVGPVATVDPLVIGQAGGTGLIDGLAVDTLGEISLAGPLGEQSEGVLAGATGQGNHLSLTLPTVNGPVVVAVVMDSTLAVEEEAILAVFLSQGAVYTQVEGIAVVRVWVRLDSFFLWALVVAKTLGCGKPAGVSSAKTLTPAGRRQGLGLPAHVNTPPWLPDGPEHYVHKFIMQSIYFRRK